jgi:hypothetical protein
MSAHSASLKLLAKYTLYLSDLVKSILSITMTYIAKVKNQSERKIYKYFHLLSIPRNTRRLMNITRTTMFMM